MLAGSLTSEDKDAILSELEYCIDKWTKFRNNSVSGPVSCSNNPGAQRCGRGDAILRKLRQGTVPVRGLGPYTLKQIN